MKILIAAGGTGGHLFPALAVTESINELCKANIEFQFFGRKDKIEGRVVPALGYKLHTTKLNGLVNFLSFNTLKLPFQILFAVLKLIRLIRREDIDAVICTGAYLSYPAGLAASFCKKKLFLMESNVNPGKTISMLAKRADTIFTTFDETANFFAEEIRPKLKNYGNPIRNSILEKAWQMANKSARVAAYNLFNLQADKPVLLVFGGSLGAKAINEAMWKWKDNFALAPYQILWQTGHSARHANLPFASSLNGESSLNDKPDVTAETTPTISQAGNNSCGQPATDMQSPSAIDLNDKPIVQAPWLPDNIKCVEFIDDMAAAYSIANLVVCRAGATSVAELCTVGKPSVLVPLPSASNNEQHYNATYLAKHGAAEIISNADISERLFEVANKLMLGNKQLQQMGESAIALAKPEAGYKIAKYIVNSILG